MKKYPSQAKLRELFDYDPEGFLVWSRDDLRSEKWNARWAGKEAGTKTFEHGGGFRARVRVNGKYYPTMNLIWIWHHGGIREGEYVKSNGDLYSGLKIEDLYLSRSRSKTHAGVRSHCNANGYIGVRRQTNGNYQSLGFGGGRKRPDLGTFKTAVAAAAAYDAWGKEYYGKGFTGNMLEGVNYESQRVTLMDRAHPPTRAGSGFRGVYRNSRSKKRPYYSKIQAEGQPGKERYLGAFTTKEEAARAYNIAAHEYYGDQAVLNDIPDPLGKGDIF